VAPELPDIPNPFDWLTNLDPRKWAGDILNAILTTIGKALLEAIRGFVDWALGFDDSSLNFVTRTPAEGTYGSPTVRALWDFSRALVNVALARQRDFRGMSPDTFDGRGNYSLGLDEQLVWPEIDYDSIDRVRGMQICIVTTAKTDEEARHLLRHLGMPFKRV
jgi:hypothetical protein